MRGRNLSHTKAHNTSAANVSPSDSTTRWVNPSVMTVGATLAVAALTPIHGITLMSRNRPA